MVRPLKPDTIDHVMVAKEWQSCDCPRCGHGGLTVVEGYYNGWVPITRREQRRARKAAKNLVMYKMVVRRPWDFVLCALGVEPVSDHDMLHWSLSGKDEGSYFFVPKRLDHLREPSGFVAMSRAADAMKPRYWVGVDLGSEPAFTVLVGPDGKVQ